MAPVKLFLVTNVLIQCKAQGRDFLDFMHSPKISWHKFSVLIRKGATVVGAGRQIIVLTILYSVSMKSPNSQVFCVR